MAKFIACLVLMPNLKTLEVFSTNHNELFLGGLKQKSARFPSVRELGISEATVKLVGNCPNVEGVTVRGILFSTGAALLGSHGKELGKLKRVVGVHEAAVKPGRLKGIPFWELSTFIDDTSRKSCRASRTSKKFASRVQLGSSISPM